MYFARILEVRCIIFTLSLLPLAGTYFVSLSMSLHIVYMYKRTSNRNFHATKDAMKKVLTSFYLLAISFTPISFKMFFKCEGLRIVRDNDRNQSSQLWKVLKSFK